MDIRKIKGEFELLYIHSSKLFRELSIILKKGGYF